ncbi:helix-turn-helix domain-containing protein [Cloacibacillus porcorum]|uniref:helix-turn-helix domain-containing protein n=1 Tax=Cloacibacillus porcorum TaxID=1197717 RepID=UPI00267114B5|nr:helix-turn-helix transcriptional regulator [Cloacibacillus porcorum]
MNNFRLYREKAQLKQGEAAEKLGISHMSLSRYENGTREPKLSEIRNMSKLYGVSVDTLINPTLPLPEVEQGRTAKAAS